MLLNLLASLTDPDNIPSGYGGFDWNNGGTIIVTVLLIIILVLFFAVLFFALRAYWLKERNKEKITELLPELSEEEKQAISDFRKLTEEEKQIIITTMKSFNKSKDK